MADDNSMGAVEKDETEDPQPVAQGDGEAVNEAPAPVEDAKAE